ncbi:SAV_2336 N-terminal domain-related protein [Streptomyces malaysiensis]|uniref:SAV_2336 N-terminal domain-related protein n=3 Tax=Streptomyces TaxID=1883 RepID=UPI0011E4CC3B|nr:SAV_2336 N-terminal domain-related protein [Streptomyces autolyticus]
MAGGGTGRLARLDEAMAILTAGGLELSREELLDALWLAGRLPEDGPERAPLARAVTRGGTALPATRPEPARPAATASPAASVQQTEQRSAQHTAQPTGPARTPRANGSVPGAQPSAPAQRQPDGPRDQRHGLTPPRNDRQLRGLYGGSQGAGAGGADGAEDAAADARRALPLRVPEDKALHQELSIGRALRPLKQHRPNPLRREFDEAATATALAETGLPDVVTRPARERWLDLALVIDDGMSMLLWRRLAVELRTVLQRSGAFRVVRVLGLRTRGGDAPALRARPYAPDAPLLPTTALSDPSGHTLVLVVSDGVGAAWRDGRMGQVLARWAGVGPTAVVHALPPRLWEGSGIRARRWQVRTRRPGSANTDWTVADPVLPAALARFEGVPVPVLEPDPGPLADWARLIASASGTAVLPLLDPGRGGPRPAPAAAPGPADEVGRVQRFRDAASPEAYRLAAHMAAVAPLPVPVMRMVQKAVDGRTDTGRLAEVFLGGLMLPVEPPASAGQDPLPPEHRPFTFTDAAQRALLGAVPLAELVSTSRLIGRRLEQLAGRSPDFPAWLADPGGSDRLPAGARPFSAVERRLAARLGAPPRPSVFTMPTAAVQWRHLEPGDPHTLGPYRLTMAGPPGARLTPYLGQDAYDAEAVLQTARHARGEAAAALLDVQAEALRRMDGRYARRLLREGLTDDVPWIAEEAFIGERLDYVLRGYAEQWGDRPDDALLAGPERWDGHTALALARKVADAVRTSEDAGVVHGDLSVSTVHIAGEDILLTGWSSAAIDGTPSPASAGGRPPAPEDNVKALGDILLCLGGGALTRRPAPGLYFMPRWSSAVWEPLRAVVMACRENPRRHTAYGIWELLMEFRPDAAPPRARAEQPSPRVRRPLFRPGGPLACSQCGNPLEPDDRFCDGCGVDLYSSPPVSAPPRPEPGSARAPRTGPGSGLPSINGYRAHRRLGGSGGRDVYLARRPGGSKDVVIRVAPGAHRELRAEAEALRRMSGHYAPRLLIDGSSLDSPSLVVECARLPDGSPAPPLSSLLGRRADGSPRLTPVHAATIGLRIAEAVNMCALKGVVPGTLTADTVLVADGTVKLIGWTDANLDDRLPGAPTPADSVYAMGGILRALSDAQPTGDLIRTNELWRNPHLLSIISACLDERPGRRPSAGRVADVFVQCLPSVPTWMSSPYEVETSSTTPSPDGTGDAEPAPTTASEPPPDRSAPPFTRALRSLFQRGGGTPEADLRHKLDQVRLPRTGSHHLAVISRAVGAGRTTTAIALGEVLAGARQGRVVAVDAVPGGDSLSRRVTRESEATLRDVAHAEAHLLDDYTSVRRFTSQTSGGLEVLAGDPRPITFSERSREADDREYRRVIDALRQHYPVVLSASDTGGLRDSTPGVLDLADQLIIVTSPFVERMRSAHTTLDRLIADGYTDLVERAIVVLNTHRENPPADPEGLATGFRIRCRGVVVVPYDQHLAPLGKIDLRRLAPGTLDAYLELAALVAEGYPGAGD